ncbi:MAG: helix-turn-helix transcriptional regulator [Armatimonadota bacterium]|nr:helix-turn-helix transcriptional regulator [Armatimonadota bacterium]
MTDPIEYDESSGNVFADLSVRQPEEALLKAELAMRISELIENRELSQEEAARVLGVRQPHISKLIRGQLRGFSIGRLLKFLVALDQDVELVIRPNRKTADSRGVRVYSLK